MIDTSALVAIERAAGSWEGALASIAEEPATLPAVVCAELLAGVHLASSAARAASRRAKIQALVATVPVVDFGLAIAERWAELFAALTRQGSLIPANDLAGAATALHLGFAAGGPQGRSALPEGSRAARPRPRVPRLVAS